MEETNETVKVREVFSVLSQGVQIKQYIVHRRNQRSSVLSRILWLDSDIFRLCVDEARPSITDRIKGKIPPGLYLRDISEVRTGSDCFHFSKNSSKPANRDNCLSLVGSEWTIAIELPSKFTRDWFYERFQLLIDDISMAEEKKQRRFKVSNPMGIGNDHINTANHLKGLLARGIQVQSHRRDGTILPAAITYDMAAKQFILKTPVRSYFNFVSIEEKRVDLMDIAELRPGSHSLGFVKTKCTSRHGQALSIISSEWVLDLELISETARNLFLEKMFVFIMCHRNSMNPKGSSSRGAGASAAATIRPQAAATSRPQAAAATATTTRSTTATSSGSGKAAARQPGPGARGAVVRTNDIEVKLGDE